ncbi:MAG: hypothetical protein P1V36_15545 [Planctomycetota bacterium]|nr:hypothetical protein [Planctomycetota bacterium]
MRTPPTQILLRLGLRVGIPVLLWYTTEAPFGWIALWFGALLLVMGVRQKRALIFNLAWVFVLIAGTELILWGFAPDQGRITPADFQKAFSAPHEVLGYAPVANTTGETRRELDGKTVYEVLYTIGPDGWRSAPPPTEPPATASCVCFGCSFMFGMGVADDEALPYRLEAEMGGRTRVHNCAFLGWGPHQMLAALESGLIAETVTAPPRHAIFLTSVGHAERAAGKRRWDKRGPRYELNASGGVTRTGTFAENPAESYWDRRKRKFLGKSWLLKTIAARQPATPSRHDLELWIAITRQARDFMAATWPGCEFHVLLWDSGEAADAEFIEQARLAKVPVHRVSEILPEFSGDWLPWSVDRFDPHPNAKAHAELARYAARTILGAKPK